VFDIGREVWVVVSDAYLDGEVVDKAKHQLTKIE
jgi:hypothetical protein